MSITYALKSIMFPVPFLYMYKLMLNSFHKVKEIFAWKTCFLLFWYNMVQDISTINDNNGSKKLFDISTCTCFSVINQLCSPYIFELLVGIDLNEWDIYFLHIRPVLENLILHLGGVRWVSCFEWRHVIPPLWMKL